MSVTILTARAHRLFAPVVEALGQCARKGEDVLLLVPEQFTLAAERGVMERLSLTGMFLIDVMSPSRLSEQVLAAAGRDGREPLDAAGRRVRRWSVWRINSPTTAASPSAGALWKSWMR